MFEEREALINVLLNRCDQKNLIIQQLQIRNAELEKKLASLSPVDNPANEEKV